MSNSLHHQKQSKQRAVVDLHFVGTILGHATPASGTFTVVEGSEWVESFTRTGVGAYRLTLREKYNTVVGLVLSLFAHGGAARQVVPSTVAINPASGTKATADFVVTTEALVAGETPANETDRVYLTLSVKNTSVAK